MALEKIVSVIKEHPVPIGAGVALLLILMLVGKSSGSGSTAQAYAAGAASANIPAQQIAAQSQVQLAGIDSQNSAIRSAAATQQFETGANLAAVLDTNSKQSLVAQTAGMLNYLNNQSAINSQSNIQAMQITNNHSEVMSNMQDQLIALQLTTSAAMGADQHQFILGSRALDIQDKNLTLTAQNLPAMLQHQETMYSLQSQRDQNLAAFATWNHSLDAANQGTLNNAAAGASKSNSLNNTIGTVASVAALLL